MRIMHFAAAAAVLIGGTAGYLWPAHADPLPMDRPLTVNGIETACTGIGDAEQTDPLWKEYPVRIEFSNGGAQYLAGAHLTLSQKGKMLASFDCSGSWVLFKNLKPGETYTVAASIHDEPGAGEKTVPIKPPKSGQQRFVIQFPVEPGK